MIKSIRSLLPIKIDLSALVINDCSKDDTLKVLIDNNITYIDLPLNLGIGGCVQTGYRYALQNEYEIAIQIDGDGQHDTAYLKDVIEPLIKGLAVCNKFIRNIP
ncbi:glycosyltransferase [uncultured Ligilactobacillus sp.]|uniref:glycosyltransferase n=1 Tax=uncultured Ligilactobacillus sp. TaxID=2837633 RepID=UPI00351D599D